MCGFLSSLDPFAFKRNVARSLNSQMVFEYIQECFRAAYKYFAVPQGRRREEGETAGRQGTREEKEESDCDEEDGLDLMVGGNEASSSDLLDREEEEDLLYVFDKMIFTGGKVFIIFTSLRSV